MSWKSIGGWDTESANQDLQASHVLRCIAESLNTLPLLNSVRLISIYIGSLIMPEVDKQAQLWSRVDLALANINRFPHLELVRVVVAYHFPGAEAERYRDDLRHQLRSLARSGKLEADIG
jgi:hypothetical protein